MNRLKRIMPFLGLALILAAAFGVRSFSYGLPSVPADAASFFREESGEPYFADPDSYYYLRKAAELSENDGSLLSDTRGSDPLIGSRQTEDGAPRRRLMGLPAMAFLIWRLLSLILPVSLQAVCVWIAPVLSSLAAVPPFLFFRKYAGTAAAMTAAALTALAVPFAAHSCAGYFDTDLILSVLPLTVMLCTVQCMKEKETRRQLPPAFLSAAALALTSLFWDYYSLYFLLPFGSGFCCLLLSAIRQQARRKRGGGQTEAFRELRGTARGWLLCTGLSTVLLLAVQGSGLPASIESMIRLAAGTGTESGALPDASLHVIEMRPVPMLPPAGTGGAAGWIRAGRGSLLTLLGGLPACLAAALAIPAEAVAARSRRKKRMTGMLCARDSSAFEKARPWLQETPGVPAETACRGESPDAESSPSPDYFTDLAFFLPWLAVTLPAALRHERFAQLAVLPVALLAGLFAARAEESLRRTGLPAAVRTGMMSLLFLFLALPVLWGAGRESRNTLPAVTDVRASAMEFIRQSLPEDTAVASWWDDGYYTEYAARRRSVADGGTYSSRMNFFLARAFLTEDPRLCRGIIRMLENAGTDAMDLLSEGGISEEDSLRLLLRILPLSREKALSVEDPGFPPEEDRRKTLLTMTHPAETRPLVLVLGTDLLLRIHSLADLGFHERESGEAAVTSCVFSEESGNIPDPGQTAELSFHESNYRLTWTSDEKSRPRFTLFKGEGERSVGRLRIWQQGQLIYREDSGAGPAVIILLENDRWCAAVMSPGLCDTVLVRLLLCEDRSMEGFVRLGTWYGPETDPSAAQRRMTSWNMLSWCTQVFAVQE